MYTHTYPKIYPLRYSYECLLTASYIDAKDSDIDAIEEFKDDEITYIPFDVDDFDVDASGDIDENLDLDKKQQNMTRDKLNYQ